MDDLCYIAMHEHVCTGSTAISPRAETVGARAHFSTKARMHPQRAFCFGRQIFSVAGEPHPHQYQEK